MPFHRLSRQMPFHSLLYTMNFSSSIINVIWCSVTDMPFTSKKSGKSSSSKVATFTPIFPSPQNRRDSELRTKIPFRVKVCNMRSPEVSKRNFPCLEKVLRREVELFENTDRIIMQGSLGKVVVYSGVGRKAASWSLIVNNRPRVLVSQQWPCW